MYPEVFIEPVCFMCVLSEVELCLFRILIYVIPDSNILCNIQPCQVKAVYDV